MSISKTYFGTCDGREVYNYILDNGRGLNAEILTLGGIVKNLRFEGTDVVLGRETIEGYKNNAGRFGALIGRNANRIEGGKFTLDNHEYTLALNDRGISNLHGGVCGFDKKVWDSKEADGDEPALILSLISPDGDEGFPGTVKVTVTYTLTKENALKIHYEGVSDKDTVLNMTNHSYFNLNGHLSGPVDGHILELKSSFFTPNSPFGFPTGEILSVTGTPFDFRNGKAVAEALAGDYEQLKLFGGFDHNFVLDGTGNRLSAVLKGDKTGITMRMYTDLPGVQIYTANFLKPSPDCKEGAQYGKRGGICFETQYFPNAFKFPHFAAPVLKKGGKYDTTTEYKFSK